MKSRVSVIIPAHNSEETLERCVLSALAQSFPPSEILIYDDCSTDRTLDVAKALGEQNPTIKVVVGLTNQGAGHARTQLLQCAKGTHFAFLDADDTWFPEKLEKQLGYMETHDLHICACSYEISDIADKIIGTRRPPSFITNAAMHVADWLPTSMTVVRADIVSNRSMPKIRRRQDYAYWLILFRDNPGLRCGSLDEVLGRYYRSTTSLSANKVRNVRENFNMFRYVMGYSVAISSACVLLNIGSRLFRT